MTVEERLESVERELERLESIERELERQKRRYRRVVTGSILAGGVCVLAWAIVGTHTPHSGRRRPRKRRPQKR